MTKKIQGVLEAYAETGTEGILWSVYADRTLKSKFMGAARWIGSHITSKIDPPSSYDRLNILEDNDVLTIFNDEAQKEILWQGKINLDYDTAKTPEEPHWQEISGNYVHGVQRGIEPQKWLSMFAQEKPARLERNP